MKTETKQAQIVTASELNERIQAHLAQFDTDKAKWKACKGLLKWRFYSPQLNLWASLGGLGGLEIVPVTDPAKAIVFDARDNAESKQKFYTSTTGIVWSIELCAS